MTAHAGAADGRAAPPGMDSLKANGVRNRIMPFQLSTRKKYQFIRANKSPLPFTLTPHGGTWGNAGIWEQNNQ